jgi:pilus retraction protein PilT
MVRVEGDLRFLDLAPLDAHAVEVLMASVLDERLRHELRTQGYADFAIEPPHLGRFRINCFRAAGVLAVAVRRVKKAVPTLADLHLPECLAQIADWPDGLVLMGGPTGCGKTTTIASIIDRINHRRAAHIITVEDPIEYLHTDDRSMIHQRELGLDVPDMVEALRSVVREDPDVVMLGEIRDAATVELALSAAATSAVQTINRLLDLFPPARHHQIRSNLAFNLRAITNQRLLPALGRIHRLPAMETLFMTAVMRKFLLEGDINRMQDALRKDADSGSEDYRRVLLRLLKDRKITAETAIAAAPNPEEIHMALRGIKLSDGGIV